MRFNHYKHLNYLVFLSSVPRNKSISTGRLAREFKVSQQTASRVLREMEEERLISRQLTGSGQLVKVTSEGKNLLIEAGAAIETALNAPLDMLFFTGKISSGIGEGAYYMRQKGYIDQFRSMLNCEPFHGTLNLELSKRELKKKEMLNSINPLRISGFKTSEREFGAIRCYPCRINRKVDGFVIIPERISYAKDLLEVISEKNLKEALKLNDGDKVKVEVWQK